MIPGDSCRDPQKISFLNLRDSWIVLEIPKTVAFEGLAPLSVI